jgi:hypothetical protein
MKFLGHCRYPKWTEDWIVDEFGVLHDGLCVHGVDNSVAHFFDVDTVENAIRRLGECLWECIRRGCVECKVDDMIEGLG